ncbi:aldehyde ferredoxin oxidoreductase family protein [Chloroflexota bacterium]
MAELYGWTGKILRVDLTTGESTEVPTSDYVPRFIGGSGVCAKVAWDELPPEVGAFDPENKLMFMNGPMAGTLVPASGRVSVGFISPHTYPTEDYVRSNFGGRWGPELEFAGYDGLIVQGKAAKPVWLWINDGVVEIRDAAKYWGLDLYSTEEAIWDDLGSKKAQVVAIGPAGENLVRFAVLGTGSVNFAGIGGAGAVMGSKNLKAIAVRGTGGVRVAKPDELMEYALWVRRQIYRGEARPPYGLSQIGSHRLGRGLNAEPAFFEKVKNDSIKAQTCFGCPIACIPLFSFPGAMRAGTESICVALNWYRPYSLARYGHDTADSLKAAELVNILGVDCNEPMRIFKWLENCYKEGLLSEEETGISLKDIGEYECAERLLNKIAYRDGFGDKLAEGIHRACDAIGKVGEEFIDHANRGFKEAHTPRIWPTTALASAMDSSIRFEFFHPWSGRIAQQNPADERGAGWVTLDEWVSVIKDMLGREDVIDHTGDAYYAPNKGWLAKWLEDYRTVTTAMGLCDWVYPRWWSWYSDKPYRRGFSPEAEAKIFSLATGVDMGVDMMMKAGERIRNMERAIMVREGRRRGDDKLGDKFFTKPTKDMPVPGPDGVFVSQTRTLDREKFERLKDAYYEERGWDVNTGIPTRAKLEELDLKDIADELGI